MLRAYVAVVAFLRGPEPTVVMGLDGLSSFPELDGIDRAKVKPFAFRSGNGRRSRTQRAVVGRAWTPYKRKKPLTTNLFVAARAGDTAQKQENCRKM